MPIELIARMNSTPTGMSVSCIGVMVSVNGIRTAGPNGITANARNAGTVDSTGARMKIALSAAVGMMSSFSASFTPSARDCSRPKGPFTFGPMRCCIRATTRRSNQMLNSVSTTRITKISTALRMTTHDGVVAEALHVVGAGAVRGGRDQLQGRCGEQCAHACAPFGASRTTDPAGADQPDVVGVHTTPSGRSATATGSVVVPRSPETSTCSPAVRPSAVERARGDQRDRRAGRRLEVVVAVEHPAVVEQQLPGRQRHRVVRLGGRPRLAEPRTRRRRTGRGRRPRRRPPASRRGRPRRS